MDEIQTTDNQVDIKFTDKELVFIDNYVNCLNATRSALIAGYSPDSARQIASNLLAKVYIRQEVDRRLAARHLSKDDILGRLERIAKSDIGVFLDDNGVPDLSSDTAKENLDLIQSIDVDVSHGSRGDNQEWETIKTRIKPYSKVDALELLGRAQRMFTDSQVDVDINIDAGALGGALADMIAKIESRRVPVIDVSPDTPQIADTTPSDSDA